MLKKLMKAFASPVVDEGIAALYCAIVAQSRLPAFYATLGVPDTVDGRFDLLVLHIVLVLRRLGDSTQAKQALFDLMFADMDRNLREMGVGDMSIGKRIRPMISAFYGRAEAYEAALANNTLPEALKRNLYRKSDVTPAMTTAMTHYMLGCIEKIANQPVATILSGRVEFATPSP